MVQQQPISLQAEALNALLEGISAFANQEISPRSQRPENSLLSKDFEGITHAAKHTGLLDNGALDYGLWADCLRGESPAFSLQALRVLAQANVSAAWHLHSMALAGLAAQFAGLKISQETALSIEGSQGIGRSALGRLLASRPLHQRDHVLLADVFGERHRVAVVAPTISQLAVFKYQHQTMQLAIYAIKDCKVERDTFVHGLDGCHALHWSPSAAPLATGTLNVSQLAVLLAIQQLAQVVMARACLQRGAQLARDYAYIRIQGTRCIEQHDSVALLIADMDTAADTVDALLRDAATHTVDVQSALSLRKEAMALLTGGVNAAMQIHGGIAYMRDTGVEHLLRSVNCLRVLGGSVPELALVVAGFNSNNAALPTSELAEADHLPAFLAPSHKLSPFSAFKGVPLLRQVAAYTPLSTWEVDTRSLPWALRRLRRRVRAFAQKECLPLAAKTDQQQREHHYLSPNVQQLLQRAGCAGLLTDLLPAPFGSAPPLQFQHALTLQQAIRVEELARVDGGLMLLLSAHSLGVCPLLLSGDMALMRRVVLPALRATQAGEPHIFAFAITEPSAGSDVEEGHGASQQKAGVKAQRVAGGWHLTGRKIFISGGDIARYISVFAALEGEGYDSWTCFLVDTQHSTGFKVSHCELKMGMRASGAAELEFDACFVPDDYVVGGLRNGWGLARATLNISRLPVAAMAVGFAQQAVDIATDYACSQSLAGQPLIHYQQIQATLADLQAETSAIRALVWHHAKSWTARQDGAAMCKFQATDRAQIVIETVMDMLGAASVLHQQRIERTFRDCRLTRIFEGTNQINRLAVIEDQQSDFLRRIVKNLTSPFWGASS